MHIFPNPVTYMNCVCTYVGAVVSKPDDELSTGAAVAITFVITFIITLVVTALITYIITSLYYKRHYNDRTQPDHAGAKKKGNNYSELRKDAEPTQHITATAV